jgi:hypothetical protein
VLSSRNFQRSPDCYSRIPGTCIQRLGTFPLSWFVTIFSGLHDVSFSQEHGHSHGHSHQDPHKDAHQLAASKHPKIVSPNDHEITTATISAPRFSHDHPVAIRMSLVKTAKDGALNAESDLRSHDDRDQDTKHLQIPPLRPMSSSSSIRNPTSSQVLLPTPSQEGDHRGSGDSRDKSGQGRPWIPPLRPLSYSSLHGYPAATRAMLIQTAHDMALQTFPPNHSPYRRGNRVSVTSQCSNGVQNSKAASNDPGNVFVVDIPVQASLVSPVVSREIAAPVTRSHHHHHGHGHHGHSHSGSMNMRALVLHVFGDALGNIGVIATGLIIWFAKGKFRFYFDPIVSLIITVIIFSSALPLGKWLLTLWHPWL